MYKILIINDIIQNIHRENIIKYLKVDYLVNELKSSNYDLIYLNNKDKTEEIEKHIQADFMKLPPILNKLAINKEAKNTYINLQFINRLIMNNLQLIKFKDYFEEIVTSNIIKQMLIEEQDFKKFFNNICPNKFIETKVKIAIQKTIIRNYAGNSMIRKLKYVIYHRKIEKMFFNDILVNIKKDINKMQEL